MRLSTNVFVSTYIPSFNSTSTHIRIAHVHNLLRLIISHLSIGIITSIVTVITVVCVCACVACKLHRIKKQQNNAYQDTPQVIVIKMDSNNNAQIPSYNLDSNQRHKSIHIDHAIHRYLEGQNISIDATDRNSLPIFKKVMSAPQVENIVSFDTTTSTRPQRNTVQLSAYDYAQRSKSMQQNIKRNRIESHVRLEVIRSEEEDEDDDSLDELWNDERSKTSFDSYKIRGLVSNLHDCDNETSANESMYEVIEEIKTPQDATGGNYNTQQMKIESALEQNVDNENEDSLLNQMMSDVLLMNVSKEENIEDDDDIAIVHRNNTEI